MAKRQTSDDIRRAFEAEIARIHNALVLQTALRVDELSPTAMNSRERKQKLADELNREARRMFSHVVKMILTNKIGTGVTVKPNPELKGFKLPVYSPEQQLKPKYLERKKEKGLPTPSFFRYSGHLTLELLHPEHLPHFQPEQILVSRATEGETMHKVKGVPGAFKARKVIRNALGQFATKMEITSGWQVHLVIPEAFQGKAPHPEKLLFSEDSDTLQKLTNRGRVYRPLLAPYLGWYRSVVIPQAIRDTYQKPRR